MVEFLFHKVFGKILFYYKIFFEQFVLCIIPLVSTFIIILSHFFMNDIFLIFSLEFIQIHWFVFGQDQQLLFQRNDVFD
jgi:hypothetical protein